MSSSKLSKPQLLELLEKKEREIEARASELKVAETKVAQLRATLETVSEKISQTSLVVEEHQSLVLRHAEAEKQLAKERSARIRLQKAAQVTKAPTTSSPIAETASCANLSTAAAGSHNTTNASWEDLVKKLREERTRRETAERLLEDYKSRQSLAPVPQCAGETRSNGAEETVRLMEALRVAEGELKGARAASRDLSLRQSVLQEERKKLVQELRSLEDGRRQALGRVAELESALKNTSSRVQPHSLVGDLQAHEAMVREMRRKLNESEAARQRAEKEAVIARQERDKMRRQLQAPRQDSCPPSSFSLPSAAQGTAGIVRASFSRGADGQNDHLTRFEGQLKEQKEQMAIMQSEIKWLRKKVEPLRDEPAGTNTTASESLAVTRSGGESPAPNEEHVIGQESEELFIGYISSRGVKRVRDQDEVDREKGDALAIGQGGTAPPAAPAGFSSPKSKGRPRKQQEDPVTEILCPITHGHSRRAAVILGGLAANPSRSLEMTSGFSAASVPTLLTVRAVARKLSEAQEGGRCSWEEVWDEIAHALMSCAVRDVVGVTAMPSLSLDGGRREDGGVWTGWCNPEAKRRGVVKALVSCILIIDDTLDKAEEPDRPLLPIILKGVLMKMDSNLTCNEKCALLSATGLVCKESGCLSELRSLVLNLLSQPPLSVWSQGQLYLGREQYLMLVSLLSQWPGSIACHEKEDVIGCAIDFILSRVSYLQPGQREPGTSTMDSSASDKLMDVHMGHLLVLRTWLCGADCSLEGSCLKAALDQTSRIVTLGKITRDRKGSGQLG